MNPDRFRASSGKGRRQRGSTAIEYGLIAALVVVGMLVGLEAFAGAGTGSFANMTGKISNAMSTAAAR
jgi:pilus assembly protein Flp/PilA